MIQKIYVCNYDTKIDVFMYVIMTIIYVCDFDKRIHIYM